MHKLLITARGVNLKDSVKDYIDKKIEKVSRLLNTNVEIHCEIIDSKTKIGLHKYFHVGVSLALPKAYIKVSKEGTSIQSVIDEIEPVLKRQISKHKEKSIKKNRKYKFSQAMLNL